MFHIRALQHCLNLHNKTKNAHTKICFITYYQLATCFDRFCDHHKGGFTGVLGIHQIAKLYKRHSALCWMSLILSMVTKCQPNTKTDKIYTIETNKIHLF